MILESFRNSSIALGGVDHWIKARSMLIMKTTAVRIHLIYLSYLLQIQQSRPMNAKFTVCPAPASLFTIVIMSFAFLVSCSPAATQITGSWKGPDAGTYKDFFVAVLSKNLAARSTLETDISSRLKKEGVQVTPSLDVFPHSDKVETPEERKAAVEKIQSLGHDAIITIKLVKKTEDTRYIPGKTQYAPMNIGYGTGYNQPMTGTPGTGYYGTFGGYYTYNYSTYSTPSYYEMDKTYFVESNVYDARTAKLVWSAQSETFNPFEH